LTNEISLYYDARSKKHQNKRKYVTVTITVTPDAWLPQSPDFNHMEPQVISLPQCA